MVEQGLPLLQIECVEALREPAVDRGEKVAGALLFALIAPQPRHARRGAQFPELCLLTSRNLKRTLENTPALSLPPASAI
jgi:hypothetical protein